MTFVQFDISNQRQIEFSNTEHNRKWAFLILLLKQLSHIIGTNMTWIKIVWHCSSKPYFNSHPLAKVTSIWSSKNWPFIREAMRQLKSLRTPVLDISTIYTWTNVTPFAYIWAHCIEQFFMNDIAWSIRFIVTQICSGMDMFFLIKFPKF